MFYPAKSKEELNSIVYKSTSNGQVALDCEQSSPSVSPPDGVENWISSCLIFSVFSPL
jgi:hypothetical protein